MAWRDDMREASFRGVTFQVTSATLTGGRRYAEHEYPQRDVPWLEDMGRRARKFSIEAYVVGPDYMTKRDALIDALESPGPGQLVHPWLGTRMVCAQDYSLDESQDSGGLASFSISFGESGEEAEPRAEPDTEAALLEADAAVDSAVAQDFSEKFSVDKQPSFVIEDAIFAVNSAVSTAGIALAKVNTLVKTPFALANSLISAVRGALSLTSGLLNFKLPTLDVPYFTPERSRQNQNREAVSSLIASVATSRRAVEIATADMTTFDSARASRTEIVSIVDKIVFAPETGNRTADAMVALRSCAVANFAAILPTLPRLARTMPLATLPAIVHSHEFYGEAWYTGGRDAEIVRLNGIRHPGFVPSGKVLEWVR